MDFFPEILFLKEIFGLFDQARKKSMNLFKDSKRTYFFYDLKVFVYKAENQNNKA